MTDEKIAKGPSRPAVRAGPGLALVSISIALLSLGAALFQGFINARNLNVVQRDLARREHVRACKEAAELFFEAKLRIERFASRTRQGATEDGFDAALAAGRLAAVSTYLANFGEDAMRQTYTALSGAMRRMLDAAGKGQVDEAARDEAERLFASLNADCVKASRLD